MLDLITQTVLGAYSVGAHRKVYSLVAYTVGACNLAAYGAGAYNNST